MKWPDVLSGGMKMRTQLPTMRTLSERSESDSGAMWSRPSTRRQRPPSLRTENRKGADERNAVELRVAPEPAQLSSPVFPRVGCAGPVNAVFGAFHFRVEREPMKDGEKIGLTELSELLNVAPHVVRYWEVEFPMFRRTKDEKGKR